MRLKKKTEEGKPILKIINSSVSCTLLISKEVLDYERMKKGRKWEEKRKIGQEGRY